MDGKIYYNEELDHNSSMNWHRLLKFAVDENKFADFQPRLRFKIVNNRNLILTDGLKETELVLSNVSKTVIFELLRNYDNIDRYKIKLYIVENAVLYMRIYVSLNYLNNLCETYQIAPKLIDTFLRNSFFGKYSDRNYISDNIPVYNNIVISDNECPYMKYLKIAPFTHQKNNVRWMDIAERNVDFGSHTVQYAITSDLLRFSNNKMCLFIDPESSILYNEESLWKFTERVKVEYIKGGVLCDQVGLGKTLSMTCLILANPHTKSKPALNKKPITITKKQPEDSDDISVKTHDSASKIIIKKKPLLTPSALQCTTNVMPCMTNDIPCMTNDIPCMTNDIPCMTNDGSVSDNMMIAKATIIYCPRRLVGQWITEIDKYTNNKLKLKIIELSTMLHINKYSMSDLCDMDVIVVSFSLLTNKKYREQESIDLTKIYWHRVIVDEGHEVLVHDVKKLDDVRTNTEIMNTKGRYKWVCTGTPLPDGYNSMQGILSFLTDKDLGKTSNMLENISNVEYDKFIKMVFHRNTEESSHGEIFIPKVIVSTDFLEFTKTERTIYDNAATNNETTKMIQICTNIMISDETSSVLGNKALPLDQVNSAMSTHYKEKVQKLKDDIFSAETEIMSLKDKQDIEIPDLEDNLFKLQKSNATQDEIDDAKKELTNKKASLKNRIRTQVEKIEGFKKDIKYNQGQIALYTSLNISQIVTQKCPITGSDLKDIVITPSGHFYSREGIEMLFREKKSILCPFTREPIEKSELLVIKDASVKAKDKEVDTSEEATERNKWGTKMAHLIKLLKSTFEENHEHRVIIFSQWKKMLDLIAEVLREHRIEFVFCRGNVHMMSKSINRFKTDNNIKVILLSSENCSSGSNLTEATHIFLMDTVNSTPENAKAIEEQAIARAVRLGQKYNVRVKKLIMKNTIEEEYYKAIESTQT